MLYQPTIAEAVNDSNIVFDEACKNWSSYFGQYSPFYHIATETVREYIPSMGNSFNTALTIGASGDQGIALIQRGAKDIYFFELNRADIHLLSLKKTALETLKRKDFMDFLIAENNGVIMDYCLYQKIRVRLLPPTRAFWDNLYELFRYNNKAMTIHLFRDVKKYGKNSRTVNDYYSNNENYYSTQRKVAESKWHFIESDFYDLDKTLPDGINFDAIVLSNIYEYINYGNDVSRENAIKYLQFIKNILLPRLTINGSCMSAYLYRFDEDINRQINEQLRTDPNGWVSSSEYIAGLDLIKKYFTGYTGQNVAYHYLYDEISKGPGVQKVKTKAAGFGMSNATTDMAFIQKKIVH